MKGLSASNLKYMRVFAQECPEHLIGQQTADQLPWFHIVTLLTRVSAPTLRDWLIRLDAIAIRQMQTLTLGQTTLRRLQGKEGATE